MLVKVDEGYWINLNYCRKVQIRENSSNRWSIHFHPAIVGAGDEMGYNLASFNTEDEATEVLDDLWEAYRSGQRLWEREPQKILNVKVNDKWIAKDQAIDTFIDVLWELGIEDVMSLDLPVNRIPLISKVKDPNRAQREGGGYYIVSGTNTLRKRNLLEEIADKLGVNIEVTANPRG